MTRSARVLTWTLASLLLIVTLLVIVIATFDWNRVKPTLNAKVSEALQRPFAINGNLAVVWQLEPEQGGWRAWIPSPRFIAEDLTLGNPDWLKEPRMAAVKRVEFRLAPLPLLFRQIAIARIDLNQPSATLKRLADGRENWTFDFGPKDEQAEPSRWGLDIGAIGFDKGQVSLDDQLLKTTLDVDIDPLGKPIPFAEIVGKATAQRAGTAQDYAFSLKVKGRYKGQPLSGNGKIGGLLALQGASRPFPLQADMQIADTRIALAGILTDPRNLGALDLRLRLSGASLGNLYPLTGVTLPDSPAYSTDGHLVAKLHEPGGALFRYEGFNGKIGDSDIHGDLTFVSSQPRPKLSGNLVSNQLLFKDLAPLIGADSNAEQKARGGASKQPAGTVLPVEEFRTERWRSMDADVTFSGKRIVHSQELPFNDLSSHFVLDDGVLRLAPLRFGVAGGKLDAQVRLDGRTVPLQGRAQLSARGFKLKQLFPAFEPMKTSFGQLNGDADLSGRGNSVAALLATSNGELKMLINDGAISRGLMEIAGLNVGNYVVGQLFGDKEVKINCAAADFGIKEGVASTRLFVFDTENAIIYVNGTANFASEQLDLKINPESKGVRLLSLRSPLYVRGPFAKPNAGVQAVPLALRGAGMVALGVVIGPAAGLLALVAPGGDVPNQCTPLLEQMKAG
ncbi:AsmA family protein [Pseudomonas sp. BBP2017]|uniref:AsmA family protein n=1 Tax=Pseudomonas sp. BBP2017 TaxID=2109731 RepID=UPI000D1183FD|nr:AsmA family protein [Pseudomonas sp. BBP2017]PSS57518.1 AsmA family protein [Pseudomonas sp. BBP2017]